MALPVVRAFPVFYNDRKCAEAYEQELTTDPRRQPVFGAEGYLTHTRGAVTGSLNISYIVPVGGTTPDFIVDTVLQNNVEIGIPVDGKIIRQTAAIEQNTMRSNTETGRAEGTLRLGFGPPQIT